MKSNEWESLLAKIPYAGYLGLCFDEAQQRFELPARPDLVGNARLPALHGGVVGGFAETAAMLWLLMQAPKQRVPKPVDFSIDYLRSARAVTTFADCEVLKQGRRVAQVSVRCWQDVPERPIVAARVHMLWEEPCA